MNLLPTLLLAAYATITAASTPTPTALAKRSDSCVTLAPGPTDGGWDSSLTITSIVVTGWSSSSVPAAVTTAPCEFAADPDGAMGYCPNLSNGGWCDCGSAGTYVLLPGGVDNCGYAAAPSVGSIALTSTGCVSGTAVQVVTETVVPVAATTG